MDIATNILADREPFIGRVREQAQLESVLRGGERLVVITGLAGMGKARLARQVTQILGSTLAPAGGIWFSDVSGVDSRAALARAVSAALGLQVEGSPKTVESRLTKALAGRGPLLLVLACCESLEPAALRMLEGLLDGAPSLQIVVTSLIRLDLEGEHLFELGPLEPAEAVALYEDRAGRAWADRTFVAGERQAIAKLVERLDRIPLAIELAAARVRVLPPRAMLLRLGDRFELLQSRRMEERNSLERAIGLSWERLDLAEQRTLAQASIFDGGFSMEAAEEVIRPGDAAPSVTELVERLRQKGLLRSAPSQTQRFVLYESVQAFAARELRRDEAQESATAQRHATFFLRLGETWQERLGSAAPKLPGDRRISRLREPTAQRNESRSMHLGELQHEELLASVAPDRENWRAARRWWQTRGQSGEGARTKDSAATLDGLLRLVDAWLAAKAPPAPEGGPEQRWVTGADGTTSFGAASFGDHPTDRAIGGSGSEDLPTIMVPGLGEGGGLEAQARQRQDGLVVGPDAVWFEMPGQERVQLGRRGAQRRVLQALVENRLLAPGQGLSLEQMARAGWPGEMVSPAAAANRVYNCVNSLRNAGLGPALERRSEGYLLSPELPVSRSRG